MSDGEFPFRDLTVRSEGYDRAEVERYVEELQSEIGELRRSLERSSDDDLADTRLHDPEGAVTRTLAIAQETADRVLHDAQVEADRRRAEADERASVTVSEAETRAAKMMDDIERQTAEVRAQGIAAARSAIQIERDRAVAELSQIRRVRDDMRSEAVELKSLLERYNRNASEASEMLAAAASGPLLAPELPDYVADEVALAGVVDDDEIMAVAESRMRTSIANDPTWTDSYDDLADADAGSSADADLDELDLDSDDDTVTEPRWGDGTDTDDTAGDDDDEDDEVALASVISIDGEREASADDDDYDDDDDLDVIELDDDASGAFLAEITSVADRPIGLAPESEPADDSDRFLSELRSVTGSVDLDSSSIDDEAADRFFEGD